MTDHDPTTVDPLSDLLAHAIAIQGHVAQAIPATPATDRHLWHAYGLLTRLADSIRDLRAAGRLLPEGGQTREEWGVADPGPAAIGYATFHTREQMERFLSNTSILPVDERYRIRRTVTVYPDGSALLGPWEPVPNTATEGATS